MAKVVTQQQALSADQHQQAIEAMMARLRQPRDGRGLIARLTDASVDALADSGETIARFGAATVSATENVRDSYELERERQLRRRAERLVQHALANGA